MVMKQKKGSSAKSAKLKAANKGWKRVDTSDFDVDGFDDDNPFALEELSEYTLEDDGFGGKILKAGSGSSSKKTAKNQTKAKNKVKKSDNDNKPTLIEEEMEEPNTQEDAEEKIGTKVDVTSEGKTKKKRKRSKKSKGQKSIESSESTSEKVNEEITEDVEEELPPYPDWEKFKLHPTLNASLRRLKFTSPTKIQALTLVPAMIDQRDVAGAAPTGSGKTLAFGMPVLQHLLSEPESRNKCRALILTPTRELAIQIVEHLQAMVPNKRTIGIVALVGGMAVQKQIRQLSYSPEIVVATPGRLWEMMQAGETTHFDELHKDLRFLIVDEADRMLQQGSFPELQQIFEHVKKGKVIIAPNEDDSDDEVEEGESKEEVAPVEAPLIMLDDVLQQKNNEDSDDNDEDEGEEDISEPSFVRQTFLFSATMTLKNAARYQTKKMKNPSALTMLETIMKRIGLRGRPAVVDLSAKEKGEKEETNPSNSRMEPRGSEVSLPEGLELAQVECLDENRNNCLYYFLTQYPGRTIVFLNAISGVRKLAGVLQLLKLPVFALHAEMQQKQRLKKLEGFRANEKGILIATDVAARGLDIPSVEYVVHYHIPRSAETFVHRSGRTARAAKQGLSVSFVAPIDSKYHAQICNVLRRPSGFSSFPIDHKFLPIIKERVKLAETIFANENSDSKIKSEATWFSQMAEAADLPIDEDMMESMSSEMKDKNKINALRAKLYHILLEPLRPIGSKRKFFNLHEDLKNQKFSFDGEYNTRNATADLMQKSKKHSLKRFRKR